MRLMKGSHRPVTSKRLSQVDCWASGGWSCRKVACGYSYPIPKAVRYSIDLVSAKKRDFELSI